MLGVYLRTIIFVACFIQSSFASSSVSKMAQEYLSSNIQVIQAKASSKLSRYDFDILAATKTWSLSYADSYSDSSLENSFISFASPPKVTKSHTFGLAKDFNWGGKLTLENSLSSFETKGVGSVSISGFSQGLVYSQDIGQNFLGRKFYKKLEIAQSNYKVTDYESSDAISDGLRKFMNIYSVARLNKSLKYLQYKAFLRAKKRLRLIKKRVRDGLRERVDMYQAKSAVISQEEKNENAKLNLITSMEQLSTLLHRKVGDHEIDAYKLIVSKFKNYPKGSLENNLKVKGLEERKKLLAVSFNDADDSILPKASIIARYSTNDFANTNSDAFSNGTFGNSQKEVAVALNLSWNIGSRLEKIEKVQSHIRLKTASQNLTKSKANVVEVENSIKKQIVLFNKNIKLVGERVLLANKTLKEFNRLYKRGRADFDQVIRAEEDLINTEITFAGYLVKRDSLTYELAHLYGTLNEYLVR